MAFSLTKLFERRFDTEERAVHFDGEFTGTYPAGGFEIDAETDHGLTRVTEVYVSGMLGGSPKAFADITHSAQGKVKVRLYETSGTELAAGTALSAVSDVKLTLRGEHRK